MYVYVFMYYVPYRMCRMRVPYSVHVFDYTNCYRLVCLQTLNYHADDATYPMLLLLICYYY